VGIVPFDLAQDQYFHPFALRLYYEPPRAVGEFARLPPPGRHTRDRNHFPAAKCQDEQIRAGRYRAGSLTAITPVDASVTEINHCVYWTAPWLTALKPFLRHYVRAFLRQDRAIM